VIKIFDAITDTIIHILIRFKLIKQDQSEAISYYFSGILCEISIFFFLILIGYHSNQILPMLVILIIFSVLRGFGGSDESEEIFHFDNLETCFFLSILSLLGIFYMSLFLQNFIIQIFIICIIFIFFRLRNIINKGMIFKIIFFTILIMDLILMLLGIYQFVNAIILTLSVVIFTVTK